MGWTTALSFAGRTGKVAYDHRHAIQKYWTKAKAYLDIGKTQIVVTGHAGAGKTQLTNQMHGRARDLAYKLPPESRAVDVEAITTGNWTKLVRVLPGHGGYRTVGEIDTFHGNSELEGIIHVVDYGYVKPREAIAVDVLISDGLDTIEKLRQKNLKLEIDGLKIVLNDIKRLMTTNGKPAWLVIAVNKVDLFPDNLKDALQYYHPDCKGDFGAILRDFQKEVGKANLGIYVAKTCAYEMDFEWNGAYVSSALNRTQQASMLYEFMELIAAISEYHS
jgi:hypothetical protein